MRRWGNEGRSLMQLLHFCFSIGALSAPLFTAPFLAKKLNQSETNFNAQNKASTPGPTHDLVSQTVLPPTSSELLLNFSRETVPEVNVSEHSALTISSGFTEQKQTTEVLYAFIISASVCLVASVPFLVMFILSKLTSSRKEETTSVEVSREGRDLPVGLKVLVMGWLCVYYSLYAAVDDSFISYLMTFLVREYADMSKTRATYITSIYWASFACSRFMMMFMSNFVTPLRLLSMCLSIMFVALLSFSAGAWFGEMTVLIVFSVVFAVGVSAVHPAGYSMCEAELFPVTVKVATCISVSAGVGSMVNPVVISYLMEQVSNMWFCYTLVLQISALCIVFATLMCFVKCFINRRYGPLKDDQQP
ncbi:uncharacterized protein LOC101854307 [Aplysia californica]|uniref:Uncharacterized protein LOC101854307 n=1 Tax=Aplysia californica TaxID=6500 RepID=A0ABM1AFE1_APLCA|nr:uncharacterized protein LOC101854307 [Aplysia californica]